MAARKTAQKSWFRIYYIDVITKSDVAGPYQYLTEDQAKNWLRKRISQRTAASNVMYVLQKFINGVGWRKI